MMQAISRENSGLRAPFLDAFEARSHQPFFEKTNSKRRSFFNRLGKDSLQQLSLAGPLAINLITANGVACTNLYFVARSGTQQLAAAALGNNVAVMLGRLVLLGLCGALDTLAAQAWGAGKGRRLPLLLQRMVLFLWLHCVAISAAMLLLPEGLRMLGQDPQLGTMVRTYLTALLPSVWLEALSRPITRVLVARGTVTPQMLISLVGLPLNVATNYLLVVAAGWEYMGAAAAMSLAAGYDVILLLLYVAVSGQWSDVIGRPSARVLRGWKQLAQLAYPAASMKCAESWAFTICTLAASLLPNAYTATAAVGVSYNVYGVLFIAFVACSTAVCVTVGNRLGAGNPGGAKLAAAGSLLIVLPAWALAALVLLLPACQNVLIGLFVYPSQADTPGPDDMALEGVLRRMFVIVAGLVLLDGIQTVMSGIIQGCGRQQSGAIVNLVAFYVVALPLALIMAFRLSIPSWLPGREVEVGLGWGPEGLYLGMAAGPAIQTACYTWILISTHWDRASEAAVSAAAMASCSSLASLVRRVDSGTLTGMGDSSFRSGTPSGTGMAASLGGISPWRLPMIDEALREECDSFDSCPSAFANKVSAFTSVLAAAPQSSWLRMNRTLVAAAFALPAEGGAEVAGGEEVLVGAIDSTAGARILQDRLGEIGIEDNTPPIAGGIKWAVDQALPARRYSGSRLQGTATGCNAAGGPRPKDAAPAATATDEFQEALTSEPACLLLETCADLSPCTAARSQALIMTHGSPPSVDPDERYPLEATLEPSSPAATAASVSGLVSLPITSSPASTFSSPFPLVLSMGKAPQAQTSAPILVPLMANASMNATNSATAVSSAGPLAVSSVRWFPMGRGRALAPFAKAAVADVLQVKEADLANAIAPLQLPGVTSLDEVQTVSSAAVVHGVSVRPSSSASPAMPVPIRASSGRLRSPEHRGSGADARKCDCFLPTTSVVESSVSSVEKDGTSSGGDRGIGVVWTGTCREVYGSRESLTAALPGSADVYALSASVCTEGGSWLDHPQSLRQESSQLHDDVCDREPSEEMGSVVVEAVGSVHEDTSSCMPSKTAY